MSHGVYTIRDVAMILKVSEKTVYRMIKERKLPHIRVGKQIRVSAAVLERYLQGGDNNGKTTTGKSVRQE